ncbi:MAG: chemotaxis protein CheW [Pseudonocardiales bacterium]|nr:chemotaxis protein CheW [Pseudonocardiales bacterium]
MNTVLLPLGDDLYAVPVEWVREVITAPPITRLLTAPASVLGLFNLRGEIVPLLDAAVLLGVGETKAIAFCIVLNSERGPAALATTGLPHRGSLEDSSGPSELPGTTGVYNVGGRAVVLLDVESLLAADRLGGADQHGQSVSASVPK